MNIKVAVVTLLLGLGATEAMAQPGWYRPFVEVSPYEVVRILRARGLVPVSRPALVGPNYVVQAADRNGDLKRVVVDAAYGDIVRVISLNRPPPPPAPPAWARPPRPLAPDDEDDDVATLPPAAIPGRPRTAAVTPLPRPRPTPAAPGPVVPKPDPSEQPMSRPDVPAAEAPKADEPPPATAAAPAPPVVLPGAPAATPEGAGESREMTLPTQPPARGAEPPAGPALPPVQPLD